MWQQLTKRAWIFRLHSSRTRRSLIQLWSAAVYPIIHMAGIELRYALIEESVPKTGISTYFLSFIFELYFIVFVQIQN